MQLGAAAKAFLAKGLWEATRLRAFGRVLAASLDSDDPNVRMIAGILLVRGGRKAEPLLIEALPRTRNLPMLLRVLGDVGDASVEAVLARHASDPRPEVAQAARDALEGLAARLHPVPGAVPSPHAR